MIRGIDESEESGRSPFTVNIGALEPGTIITLKNGDTPFLLLDQDDKSKGIGILGVYSQQITYFPPSTPVRYYYGWIKITQEEE